MKNCATHQFIATQKKKEGIWCRTTNYDDARQKDLQLKNGIKKDPCKIIPIFGQKELLLPIIEVFDKLHYRTKPTTINEYSKKMKTHLCKKGGNQYKAGST